MNCPTCGSVKHEVIDSRSMNSSYNSIRRRRECYRCGTRWTTREFITEGILTKDQRDEVTNRIKKVVL